jgi:hypothetical protein
MHLIRLSQRIALTICLLCFLSGLTACSSTKPIVIPDSRQLLDLEKDCNPPHQGYVGISKGYLREIYHKCGIKEKEEK